MDIQLNLAFVIFAALSPGLIALVKQSAFSPQINALIALLCYFVVGIVGAAVSGLPLTLEGAPALISMATLIGSAVYNLVWSKIGTGDAGNLPSLDNRITAATSIAKAPPLLLANWDTR